MFCVYDTMSLCSIFPSLIKFKNKFLQLHVARKHIRKRRKTFFQTSVINKHSSHSVIKFENIRVLNGKQGSQGILAARATSQSHSKMKFKSTNHIQSCRLNQPISISECHETIYLSFISILMQIFPFFHSLAILLFLKIVIFMINW